MGLIEYLLHPERFVRVNELTDYCIKRHEQLQEDYRSVDDSGNFSEKLRKVGELAQIEGKQEAFLEVGKKFHPQIED